MCTCALGAEQSEINNCEGIARVHNHYLWTPLCCRGLISGGADGQRASRSADQPGTLAHTFLLTDPRSEHAHRGTALVSYYRRSLGSFCAPRVSDGPSVPAEGPHWSTVTLYSMLSCLRFISPKNMKCQAADYNVPFRVQKKNLKKIFIL